MNVLIVGANGQLGKAIYFYAPSKIANENVNITLVNRNQLDLCSPEKCNEIVLFYRPDFLINTAAYTNVELAEKEIEKATLVNTIAPKNFSESLSLTGGKLIHFSTDYVFDGLKNHPYKPNDKKNPLNIYGKTKSEGEDQIIRILGSLNQYFIIRTSWLIGPYGENFLIKMLNLLQKKDKIRIISDQFSAPTSTTTLANACWSLISYVSNSSVQSQICHFSDLGIASWYDIVNCISEYATELKLLSDPALIEPIKTFEYPMNAIRPRFSALDLSENNNFFQSNVYWRTSIKKILQSL
tara:strand:- start:5241 stop:6131 length:891 start_codon:yes stop_codon:yes gene_type:complete